MHLSGSAVDYLFVFMGGLALSFTPCVYPLIPVTCGAIGITAGGSKRRGFLLSLLYVTGIAVTYSCLGLIAALTGKLFGTISVHPITRFTIGIAFLLFGLSMLGVFVFRLPGIARWQGAHKTRLSIFVLGLISGFIASPCIAPALGAILVYIGTTHNIFYGMTLLLTFAYGIGMTLIVAGTFSSVLLGLPKLGKWMVWIERGAGTVVAAIGLYFMYDAIRRFLS